jgi:hypothetical protein
MGDPDHGAGTAWTANRRFQEPDEVFRLHRRNAWAAAIGRQTEAISITGFDW